MLRQTSGSVVCPNCGRLVGVRDAKCFNCGRPYPGLFGFTPLLNQLGRDFNFADVVLAGCGIVFVLSLVYDADGIGMRGFFGMLSPSISSSFVFGHSGAIPLFVFDRWWTVLSASWLHGGILHIVLNMYYLRFLMPEVSAIYGVGRMIILYTVASITGFGLTSLLGFVVPVFGLPRFLAGAPFTLGASASLCGLVGALLYYARKTGRSWMTRQVGQMVVFILLFGFLMRGVDNWAHIGGFVGGYVAAMALKPLEDETPLHLLGGLLCLVAMVASLVASFVVGVGQLPMFEQYIGLR